MNDGYLTEWVRVEKGDIVSESKNTPMCEFGERVLRKLKERIDNGIENCDYDYADIAVECGLMECAPYRSSSSDVNTDSEDGGTVIYWW